MDQMVNYFEELTESLGVADQGADVEYSVSSFGRPVPFKG